MKEYISANKVAGDFVLRKWKNGEKFFPLGLKGSKKISDFLNEQKISSSKKKEQLVLTNQEKIVWVLGLRLDDRFKIKNNTEKVIELCLT
jgi:tRNA(Ile)-lysidine synthase